MKSVIMKNKLWAEKKYSRFTLIAKKKPRLTRGFSPLLVLIVSYFQTELFYNNLIIFFNILMTSLAGIGSHIPVVAAHAYRHQDLVPLFD